MLKLQKARILLALALTKTNDSVLSSINNLFQEAWGTVKIFV